MVEDGIEIRVEAEESWNTTLPFHCENAFSFLRLKRLITAVNSIAPYQERLSTIEDYSHQINVLILIYIYIYRNKKYTDTHTFIHPE